MREDGRICERTNPRTNPFRCAQCPAFRGIRWDGTVANGLAQDRETPVGLTVDEAREYEAALETMLIDEDPDPWFAFLARQEREIVTLSNGRRAILRGPGDRTMMMLGDAGALKRHAAKARAWREAHPGADKRKRKRDRAAYMRSYRAQKQAGA